MAKEIERKFLENKDYVGEIDLKCEASITQGYLIAQDGTSIRIRRCIDGLNEEYYCTFKYGSGISRDEIEFILTEDAWSALYPHCIGNIIHKERLTTTYDGKVYSYDIFGGDLQGLVLIEVELEDENEDINLPAWVGKEVTNDKRYTNASLAIDGFPAS